MTEVHSCGSPPFSTCLGAVASFIISQGQKCHKKPFPLVYYQSHKEKSVKGGHRPQRLPLILFFVGYNAGGENGCPSVPLLPPVLHCFLSTTLLAGTVTAFCGPIGFIGLAMPHVTRMLFRNSDHRVLVPGTVLSGASVLLLCDLVSKLFTLPINAITALLGIPIVVWVVLRNKSVTA